jgi:hypothetical protein
LVPALYLDLLYISDLVKKKVLEREWEWDVVLLLTWTTPSPTNDTQGLGKYSVSDEGRLFNEYAYDKELSFRRPRPYVSKNIQYIE